MGMDCHNNRTFEIQAMSPLELIRSTFATYCVSPK